MKKLLKALLRWLEQKKEVSHEAEKYFTSDRQLREYYRKFDKE